MVKFNSIEIPTAEINAHLQQEFKLKEVCSEILHQKIIAEAASARNISIGEEEIEAEANKIRSSLRLEKASDTLAWLKDNLLDPDQWETAINNQLLRQKLSHHLFDSKVDAYFAQNRLDFDRFVLYQLVVPYEKLAQELFYQIEEEEISFYQAAHLYDVDRKRRFVCGYEGEVRRWDYHPDIASTIFTTPVIVGEVFHPIKSKQGYHLFKIEDYLPAELNSKIRQEIIDKLFEQWLHSELNYLVHNQSVPAEAAVRSS